MPRWSTLAALCLGAPALSACRPPAPEAPPPPAAAQPRPAGPALASGGGVHVTPEELEALLREQPPALRAHAATPEGRKALLEQLIRAQLLEQEARRQGLDRDPEVVRQVRRLLVERLVQKQVAATDGAGAPPEAELRAYYDARRDEYVAPERVRVSHVFLAAPEGSPQRGARAQEAERLRARLEAEARGAQAAEAFARVAREASEDVTRAVGGDLTYRSHEELARQHSRALADAAFALKAEGELSRVVATPRGFHVLRLAGRRPAVHQSFEAARESLAARFQNEQRKRAFDAFVEQLRARAAVTVDDAQLARVGAAQP